MNLKQIFNCMFTAFSTYSRIPVPHGEWDDANLRWQVCFFPVVGLAIGVLWTLAAVLLNAIRAQAFFMGALLTVWPVILTGGIHMDGFLDTSDAIHSWKPREEKLQILKDPNIGAFAFIYGVLYFVAALGFMTQFAENLRVSTHRELMLFCIADGYFLSRVLSAIAILRFPKARKDGMLRTTADASANRVITVLYVELIAAVLLFAGAAWHWQRPEPLLVLAAAGLMFGKYYRMAMKTFGGTTGDIAGWFVEVTELAILAVTTLTGMLF